MVGAMRQGRRGRGFCGSSGDPHRCDHRDRRRGSSANSRSPGAGGDAENAAVEPFQVQGVPVKVMAGWIAMRAAPTDIWRVGERGQAVPARRVNDVLAALIAPLALSIGGDVAHHVVRDSQGGARRRPGRRHVGLSTGTPGRSASMRPREASDSPATATMSCPRHAGPKPALLRRDQRQSPPP